ncbi:MAG: hypothetical protein L3K06_00950 [Thermoplasmata archaeon]|nr:hypothetical protein [Thermoplasmata archaeon]MCI4353917.1 hypothetical protein [Thermoplasmata archaeon]
MVDIGFSDLLSLAQTCAIIAALLVTLYFSRRQVQAFAMDLETRVLNDLDEKFHRIGDILIERPELLPTIYKTETALGKEVPFSYYVMFFCAHIHHMRERGILRDNEWTGWFQWMRNAFRYGDLGRAWKETEMGQWFDPSFRTFVERELLATPTEKN